MKMNSPKRKVTDLLPSEAILISSDADLKVLEEFEKAGIVWVNGGEKPTEWKPFPRWEFPDRILLYEKRISRGSPYSYIEYPATDFIPTEAERGLTIIKGDGEVLTAQDIKPFDVDIYKDGKFIIYTTERDDMGEIKRVANMIDRLRLIEIAENIQSILTRNPETK